MEFFLAVAYVCLLFYFGKNSILKFLAIVCRIMLLIVLVGVFIIFSDAANPS